MSKVVPPVALELELQPGGTKAAKDFSGGKTTDAFLVPPSALTLLPNFNLRITGTPEYDAGIAELALSITENGFYRDKPFSVIAQKNESGENVFAITDGHRRFAALNKAIADGAQIDFVPVIPVRAGMSIEDLTIAMMQNGKELSPIERAIGVERLSKAGWDDDQIAKRLGMTKTYVADLHTLMAMPGKIRNLVTTGRVAAGVAVKAFRDDAKTAFDRLTAAVDVAVSRGKTKAAPRDVKAATDKPASNRGRKANPLRTEFSFEALQDDEVPLASIAGFTQFGGGAWWGLSEVEGIAVILQDVKIKGVCVLKEATPGSAVKPPLPDTADL